MMIYFGIIGNPDHFINFTKDKNVKVIKLARNYRSSNNIVQTSNKLITNNPDQIGEKAYSKIHSSIVPIISQYTNETEEANKIADMCINYTKIDPTIQYKDIAIIYRVKYMSRSIEQALVNKKIPYQIIGNIRFFERREIKDLMSYLYFINNYNDEISFRRICEAPRKGIGEKTVDKIMKLPGNDIIDKCLYATRMGTFTNKINNSIGQLLNLTTFKQMTPDKILIDVIEKFNFKNYFEFISGSQDEYNDRLDNVKELINQASQTKSLFDFIDEISLMNNSNEETINQIDVMTMHASKGLEYKVVFIIGCEYGILPHYLSFKDDEKNKNKKGLQEERRLFYVGITRSEKYLNISYCKNRGGKPKFPSPFIDEIKNSCYDAQKLNRDKRRRELGGDIKITQSTVKHNKGTRKDRIKELLNVK